MKKFCEYHSTKPAYWNCPKCGSYFCPDCIVTRKKGGVLKNEIIHLCPKCNVETSWVGVANIIEPFWSRLPKFFTYPLSLQPLALIIILSIVSLILSKLSIIGLLLKIVLWGILFKYSFSALKATAHGDLTPPGITSKTISEDFMQVFKQIAIYIIIGFIFAWLIPTAGIIVAVLFLIFALLYVPAIIILLVTTNSLLHAVNPVVFTRLAFRIGRGYFLMYFFLFLLGSAPAILGQYIMKFLPAELFELFFGFAKNYYTIISYHLMGYVILQYHEEVGYQVDYEDFKESVVKPKEIEEDESTNMLNRVNIMIKDGKLDDAISFIKDTTKTHPITNITLSERYLNLLIMKKQKPAMLKHCITHLDLLAHENIKIKACELYAKCLAMNEEFIPTSFALFKIGGWLNETGKIKEAIRTYNRMIKAFPNDTLVPKAYYRCAQIFHDRMMDPSRAKKILSALIKKYPEHEIIPQVKNYLNHMGI